MLDAYRRRPSERDRERERVQIYINIQITFLLFLSLFRSLRLIRSRANIQNNIRLTNESESHQPIRVEGPRQSIWQTKKHSSTRSIKYEKRHHMCNPAYMFYMYANRYRYQTAAGRAMG